MISALICGMVLTSCGTDVDENSVVIETSSIKAMSVENVNNNIVTVKAIIWSYKQHSDGEWYSVAHEVASSKFENGGFELIFSENVPYEFLFPESDRIVPEGVAVSDIKAKTGLIEIEEYSSTGNRTGCIFMFSNDNHWIIEFIYADRDFTEKGKTQYGEEYDCTYNEGWNIRYRLSSYGPNKFTTKKPLNGNFKCYYVRPIR